MVEQALHENEQQLRLAMDAANAGSWEMIPETGEFTASASALRLHGFPPGTAMNHERALAAVQPEDRAMVETAIRRTLETGDHFHLELRVPQPNGSLRWVATYAELHKEGGQPRLVGLVQDITERKEAEATLQAQSQLLDTIVHNMPACVCMIRGTDLRLQMVNPAYQGIAPGREMVGKTLDELWPEAGRDFTSICRQVLEAGEPYRAVDDTISIYRTEGGPLEQAYFTWELHRVRLPGDGVQGLLNVAWETTARKRAEQAAVRLATIVSTSADAIISMTLDGSITSWNESAERIFGYCSEEVIGRSITCIIPPERSAEEELILSSLKEGKRLEHFETVRVTKDGRRLDVSLSISPLRNSQGQIVGGSKIARDMTEQTKSLARERALLEQALAATAKFEAVFNQSGIFAGITNLEGHLLEANKLSLSACGYRREEVLNRLFCEAPWWRGSQSVQDRIRSATEHAAAGFVYRSELPYWCADGTERVVDFAMHPIRDESGIVRLLHPTGIDITERKAVEGALQEAQEKLRQHASTLEKTVAERTTELRKYVAQLEEFSYTVSHDLRAPLRAMEGFSTALLEDYEGVIDAEGKSFLQQIVNAARRMDLLTRDVLAYSKLSRQEVHLHSVDLEALLKEIVSQYPNIIASKAAITVRAPFHKVMGAKSLLTQALSNLLDNAVKFVTAGVIPKVEIWCERQGGKVRLFIKDNGIGIKPEHQGRLFGLFERIHPRDEFEGTGIGLAIARKALERLGGSIGVESNGESGSTFWVELPSATEGPHGSKP
ncbi:MAG: PAS domain S-box protein [Verrucomicrobiota bacterium]